MEPDEQIKKKGSQVRKAKHASIINLPASLTLGLSVKSVFEGDPDNKSSSDSTL